MIEISDLTLRVWCQYPFRALFLCYIGRASILAGTLSGRGVFDTDIDADIDPDLDLYTLMHIYIYGERV